MLTITDKKIPVATFPNDAIINYFTADVVTANDYYPGGMLMPGRKYQASATSYRYGFGGQEKSNEIKGEGNSYTAEFWEYDPRAARRWNIDPLTNKFPWQSPYTAMDNNPILKTDLTGMAAEIVTKPLDDWMVRKNGDLVLIKRTTDKEHRFFNEKKGLMYGTQHDGDKMARYSWNIWGKNSDYQDVAKSISYSKNDVEYADMAIRAKASGFPKTMQNTERTETDYLHDLGKRIRKEDIAMVLSPSPMSKFSPKKYGTVIKVLTTLNASQGGGIAGRALRVIGDLHDQESPKQYPAKSEGLQNSWWKITHISTDGFKWGMR